MTDTPIRDTARQSIYFDHQASTPLDPEVLEAMLPWFSSNYGNPHSSEHAFGWRAHSAVEEARGLIAEATGGDAENIIFTSGATESNNLALLGIAGAAVNGRNTVLVSSAEHASVTECASELRRRGFNVCEIPVDRHGLLSLSFLDEVLNERVLLVSVCAVNGEIGAIQEIEAIGERCRRVGALFHTDAAQALTAMHLQFRNLPVDIASLSSHKAYGPKGIGALYIAHGVEHKLTPIMHGGGQQRGLRPGTLPTPLCVGFGYACDKIRRIGTQERAVIASLRNALLEHLVGVLGTDLLNGSPTRRHPGNLNVKLPVHDARDVVHAVQPMLACSTGSACHSGSEEPSRVLRAIGLSHAQARSSLRLSVGRFTTGEEVLAAAQAIAQAVRDVNASSGPVAQQQSSGS